MTVAALTASVSYTENGVSLNFAVPFRYLDPTHLLVKRTAASGVQTTLAYGTDWSATAGATDAGGTLTLLASVSGSTLTIQRKTPRSQTTDYVANDRFPAETHEGTVDRAMLIDQEQDVDLARALRVPIGETPPELAPAATRAAKYLFFDASGNPVYSAGVGVNDGLRAELAAAAGAGQVAVSQSNTYAAGSVGAALKARKINLKDAPFNAVGSIVSDDLAAINLFLAAVGLGVEGEIPAGNFFYTAALNPVAGHNIRLSGAGFLIYKGAATNPGTLLTFGDGATLYQYLDLRFGGMGSTVALTGGRALRVRKSVNVRLDLNMNGPVGYQGNLYEGAWFDTTSNIDLGNSEFYTTARNVLWNDGSELHCNAARVLGKNIGGGTGIGIHLAGGCGGFYSEQINQLYNDIGLKIDTSVSANSNKQIFCDTGTFDSNKTAAIYADDAISDPLSKSLHIGAWACSTTVGSNVTIANWRNGKIHIGSSAKLINATAGCGIYHNDATVRMHVASGARISQNNVGIDAGTAVTIYGDPQPFLNTTADFGANVNVAGQRYGVQTITQDPALDWMVSAIPNTKTIANGANVKIAAGGGLIMVTNPANGENGIYNVGGSAVSLVNSNGSTFVAPTTTPAAGKVSVAWNGSNGYNVYSNFGSSQAFTIALLMKMRAVV